MMSKRSRKRGIRKKSSRRACSRKCTWIEIKGPVCRYTRFCATSNHLCELTSTDLTISSNGQHTSFDHSGVAALLLEPAFHIGFVIRFVCLQRNTDCSD